MKKFEAYAVPVFLLIIVCLFLVPMPFIILDLFLVLNFTIAVLVLMVSTSIKKPSDFSVFPALLLVLTFTRLALNIASTKLILTKGAAFESVIINTFGHWVIAGNYVVGAVVFFIFVAIQFMVISKGSERVAEVAARFRLESMPMKLMGIESGLSSGIMNEEEAILARKEVQQETDFYGAMDGASKYIKNESLLALLIVFVNIGGGIVSGFVYGGFTSIGELFKTYVLLTIGDGLVGLIPSVLVAVAAGFIITRTSSEGNLSTDLLKQLGAQSQVVVQSLMVMAVIMFVFGLFAGVAPVPFILAGSLFSYFAWYVNKSSLKSSENDPDNVNGTDSAGSDDELYRGKVFQTELFISGKLWDQWTEDGGLDRLRTLSAKVCDRVYNKRGIPLAPLQLSSTDEFEENEYALYLRGDEVLPGKVEIDGILAVGAPGQKIELKGSLTKAPSGKGRARWISFDDVEKAKNMGYKVMDVFDVLSEKVYGAIVSFGDELLGLQEMDEIYNGLTHHFPAIGRTIEEASVDRLVMLDVLKGLAEEGVSIRNTSKIFESIASGWAVTKSSEKIIDIVRLELSRQISKENSDFNDVINAVLLAPETEEEIRSCLYEASDGVVTPALSPVRADELLRSLSQAVSELTIRALPPVVIVPSDLRRMFYKFCEARVTDVVVLSCSEIHRPYTMNPVTQVSLSENLDASVHDISAMAYSDEDSSNF